MKHNSDGLEETPLANNEGELGVAATLAGDSARLAEGSAASRSTAGLSSSSVERGGDMSRFMVIDTLGSGGMSVVHSAYDPDLDRKLAIKVLRPDVWVGDATAEGKRRLMREAQAMGKVSHDNVITVYEVGSTDEGGVFIAMEYVDGPNLGEWLAEQHSWRDVVDVFIKAGRGLAAAHAVGLVHRDFKPDNVLVGNDGRVRVTDFGLVASVGETRPHVEPTPMTPSPHLDAQITRAGAVLGTPAYMAPEQHLGDEVDARADQYSYCVALYKGLCGKLPHGGTDYTSIRKAVLRGELELPPPRTANVPPHIARVLKRGLALDPDERYPTMDALLRDLNYDPAVVKRRVAAGLAVACLAGLAVYGFSRSSSGAAAEQCPIPRDKLAGVWDAPVRSKMKRQFMATRAPFAATAFDRTAKLLDDYETRWLAMRVDTCRATRVQGEQSAALLDLRMACLDRRLGAMRALTQLLANNADAMIVARSAEAVYRLPDLKACANATALRQAPPLPSDPRLRDNIKLVRNQLAEVRALRLGGRIKAALELATAVERSAERLDYKPLHGAALLELGRLQRLANKPKQAGPTLIAAADTAAAAKNDTAVAEAWIETIYVRGYLQARDTEAQAMVASARTAIIRAGNRPALRARLMRYRGVLAALKGRLDEAQTQYERAIALIEKHYGKRDFRLAIVLYNLGLVYVSRRNYDAARAIFQRQLRVVSEAYGDDHDQAANGYTGLGIVASREGNHAGAETHHRRALAIRTVALGADHPRVAQTLQNLGVTLRRAGRLDEARTFHERARAVWRKALGDDHPNTARPLASLGFLAKKQKHFDEAERYFAQAAAIHRKARGESSPQALRMLRQLAYLDLDLERFGRALPRCTRSYRQELQHNGNPVAVIDSLECMAEAEVGLGQRALARQHLDDAIARATAAKRNRLVRKLSVLRAKLR